MSILTKVLKLFCYDPETDGANTFNIPKALNENWEKIDQLVLLAVAAAAAYDPEGSYAVGDYCTNGGKLHKCGTAIPDGEPWNAAHWTETTVAKELAGKANATPPEVHNLTLASEVTNIDGYQSVYFKTQENIVTVILQCEGTFVDNQHTATLPVDCYPKRNMTIPCIDGYTRTVGFLLVNIDGTIRVSFGESEKTSAISVFSFDAAEVSK